MSVDESREALIWLRAETGARPRYQPAPQEWIDRLHDALMPITTGATCSCYRVDCSATVDIGSLHSQVVLVLDHFDQLVAARIQAEPPASPIE